MAGELAEKIARQEAAGETEIAQGTATITALRDLREQFAIALPRGLLDPDRFLRTVITTVRENPELQKCDPISLIAQCMKAAQDGLEIGELAALVPFYSKKLGSYRATYIRSYLGEIELALRSGHVTKVWAKPVWANDRFHYREGLHPDIEHEPVFDGERGELRGVYAIAHMRWAEPMFEVLSRADVEAYRARSKAADSGPWATDYVAMAKKTAVRRLQLPRSAADQRAPEQRTASQWGSVTPDDTDPDEPEADG